MANAELPKIEQLCCSSISAAITKLCNVGTWPRPPRARALRVGYDFYRNELQDIQEVNNLIEYLACDDEIKSIYFEPSYGAEQHILYEYWEQLLLKILRETKGVLPTNHIFQKWFRRFLKELYSNTAVWRSIDTIAGLTLNGVELKFDTATILISRPAYRWLDIIRREQQYDLGVKWTGIGLDKATIITTVSILKHKYAGFTSPPPHLTQHIDRHLAAVEAIRLTGSGAPRINCHVQFQRSVFPISEPLAYCDREGGPRLYEKETVLKRGDFRNVRNLWRELMDTKYRDLLPTRGKSSAIDTALARFSMSYRLQNWLDSIVDLTIALESLFYPKDTQELSHRIS